MPAYLSIKGTSSERLCLGHPFLKHPAVRESQRRRSSLVGKMRNLCRVYKLIMISRVPGYGQLEYLVLGLSYESHHHVTLINIVGLMIILNWD